MQSAGYNDSIGTHSTIPDSSRQKLLVGTAGVLGVVALVSSFAINQGPPHGATAVELHTFAAASFRAVMLAGYLQAIGPALLAFFVFGVVSWLPPRETMLICTTQFGMAVLMFVSLTEVVFYFAALYPMPDQMEEISLHLIGAVQHLYFIVAAPVLFGPFGFALARLGFRLLGWSAIALGSLFAVLGIVTIFSQTLPDSVTLLGAVQAAWWLAAAVRIATSKGVA